MKKGKGSRGEEQAMYELRQAGEETFYLECPAKIGIYQPRPGEVYLVDSGGDKDAGRRVRKLLEEQGWSLKGIMVTHSNADHIGGCRYLQNQYGCPVFAGGIEGAFTRWPVLEPAFLYGGYPHRDLRHKFLMAEGCETVGFDHPDFPREVEVIPLPGHFFDMVGYKTPDGTVFLADCLSGEGTLEKYGISFLYDVEAYLETLDKVGEMEGNLFVPAHAPATADIRPLAQRNKGAVEDIAGTIRTFCGEGMGFEELLARLFDHYGLTMTQEQYVLVGSTVRSYLSWLKDKGEVETVFERNRLYWKAMK